MLTYRKPNIKKYIFFHIFVSSERHTRADVDQRKITQSHKQTVRTDTADLGILYK